MNKNSVNNVKHDLLMQSLENFYKDSENLKILTSIINGESKISLRVIDWFVTNYSKKNNISYLILDDRQLDINKPKMKEFVVYIDYKLQLKGYQKKQFDPFCRRERIEFYYSNNEYVVTTVGQLNFFRWAIKNKIIDYVTKNLTSIENDMNLCYKAVYNLSKSNSNPSQKSARRKRQELSISATKKLNKSNVKIIVSFD
tara:strand:+ start:1524 stop:2120 length:597 start_codon:yes stop_codon:yes gene_type:complete